MDGIKRHFALKEIINNEVITFFENKENQSYVPETKEKGIAAIWECIKGNVLNKIRGAFKEQIYSEEQIEKQALEINIKPYFSSDRAHALPIIAEKKDERPNDPPKLNGF